MVIFLKNRARLAQSVERQALNLMVVGSSPTVGVCALKRRLGQHSEWHAIITHDVIIFPTSFVKKNDTFEMQIRKSGTLTAPFYFSLSSRFVRYAQSLLPRAPFSLNVRTGRDARQPQEL